MYFAFELTFCLLSHHPGIATRIMSATLLSILSKILIHYPLLGEVFSDLLSMLRAANPSGH